jgi:hypothetical protein
MLVLLAIGSVVFLRRRFRKRLAQA